MTKNSLLGKLGVQEYGIIEFVNRDPVAAFHANPCYNTFSRIPKSDQTEDLVREAIEYDDGRYEILKIVSKKRVTLDLCIKALRKNAHNLNYLPKKMLGSKEIYSAAVSVDGTYLSRVPEQYRDFDMYDTAVRNDSSENSEYCALRFVPRELIKSDVGHILCETAVKHNPLALRYVPSRYVTKVMAYEAVRSSRPGISWEPDTLRKEPRFAPAQDWPIAYIPKRYMTNELIQLSFDLFPRSIACIPEEYVTYAMCVQVIEQDGMCIELLPAKFKNKKKMVDAALAQTPRAIEVVPRKFQTKVRCLEMLGLDSSIKIWKLPDDVQNICKERKLELMRSANDFAASRSDSACERNGNGESRFSVRRVDENDAVIVQAQPRRLDTPTDETGSTSFVQLGEPLHELVDIDSGHVRYTHYVTDIHLEHQLELDGKSRAEAREMISKKIRELLSPTPNGKANLKLGDNIDYLLIGGDVADSIELETLFYEELQRQLRQYMLSETFSEEEKSRLERNRRRNVIAVLGNHELWDGDPEGIRPSRPVDEIIRDYRSALQGLGVMLLENELYVQYKENGAGILNEFELLDADDAELTDLCDKATFVCLGGIGYSGLNPKYNATMGLYRNAVNMEEDIRRSARLKAVYDKVLKCAGSRQVIVLTHTQMADWSPNRYNPNWVYINGHTHVNTLIRDDDGTTVLSDNQIGYEPQRWRLKGFIRSGSYDPLASMPDGIHEITRGEYLDFNIGHSVYMPDFKRSGKIFALKRNGLYMFFLDNGKLHILVGGSIRNTGHDMQYYYDNMLRYRERIEEVFRPYRNALGMLSKEVKSFGGNGHVHGSIVDIDFYNHIYLNPFDGTITPYFAESMASWDTYKDVPSLLASSPFLGGYLNADNKSLATDYKRALARGDVSILARQANANDMALATVPEVAMDTSMAYKPSNTMRAIQYALDQDIIRIWRDEVLASDAVSQTMGVDRRQPKQIESGE